MTKTEALVAVGSGALTGAIDSIFIKDIDLRLLLIIPKTQIGLKKLRSADLCGHIWPDK